MTTIRWGAVTTTTTIMMRHDNLTTVMKIWQQRWGFGGYFSSLRRAPVAFPSWESDCCFFKPFHNIWMHCSRFSKKLCSRVLCVGLFNHTSLRYCIVLHPSKSGTFPRLNHTIDVFNKTIFGVAELHCIRVPPSLVDSLAEQTRSSDLQSKLAEQSRADWLSRLADQSRAE